MKMLIALGLVLIALGGYVLIGGVKYTTEQRVVEVGPVEATVSEERTVPRWVGGLVLAAGVVLAVAGVRQRT